MPKRVFATELSGSDPPTSPILRDSGPDGAPFSAGPSCLRLFSPLGRIRKGKVKRNIRVGRSHGNSCLGNNYCHILLRRKVRLPKMRLYKGRKARTLSNTHAALPGPSSARPPHALGTQVTSLWTSISPLVQPARPIENIPAPRSVPAERSCISRSLHSSATSRFPRRPRSHSHSCPFCV